MPITSFNVEPGNPQAPGGACRLRLTFKLPSSETIHAFGLFVDDDLVGRVADQAGLKAGTYGVDCDLAKLGDGPQLVIARAYRRPETDPVYESPPFTVIVSGVGEPVPEPAPVMLNVATRRVVGRGKPEVLCTMVDEDGAPLSDAPWGVSVEVDGQPSGGVEVHGAQSRFVPAEALAEGLRRVEFKVTSPARPGRETRIAIPVLVDLRPPLVEVEALAAVTNDTTPRFQVRARDLGVGVDPASLAVAVDGKPYPVMVNPLDAQPPPAPMSPAPPSSPPVCGSTEATVATLRAEVALLEANPRAMKRLNMMLDSVQEALSGKYNAAARERLGRLIAAVTEMSQSGPAKSGGIEVALANSLLCGATNLLTGIPLPTGALGSPRTSSPIATTTELKQWIAASDAAEALRKALGRACDAIQDMISRQRRWHARERAAHLIQQVIRASNAPAEREDRLSLPSANTLLAGTANVLIGIPLPDRGATFPAITDLKARIAALHASKPAAASLVNALDSIQRAADEGRPAVACREAGELFADLMSRSRGGPAGNAIPGAAVDTLIDPMMGLLSMVVSLATDGAPAASTSMVATLPELRTELDLWQPAPEATRALQALLEKAERARTAGDTGELRASLGRFVADLAARAAMPPDSRERISGAEAMSLAGGAANVLLGRVAWKRFEVRPAEPLPDGEHRFSVSMADLAGNRSELVEKTILVDTQPPRVGKVVPETGAVVAARGLSVELHVSDEVAGSGAGKSSGVASVTLLVDGVDRSATATRAGDVWTWVPQAALAEGDHSLELVMVDRAGNQDRFRSSFSVDATAPVISGVLPPAGSSTNAESVLLFARLTDHRAGLDPRSVRLVVDGNDVTAVAAVAPDSVSFVLERAEERAHTVRIECADLVGNRAGATELQFVVDRTPPRVAIDPSIDELVVPETKMRVSGSVSEPAAVEVNGHAATVVGLAFTAEVPLEVGHNRLTAKAIDKAGNETVSPSVDVYRITDRDTAVAGVVRDPGDSPVAGVVVIEPRTGVSGVSNELGRFALAGLPAGEFLLQVDPGRVAGGRYVPFRVQVRTRYGQITAFDTPIYLVPSALDQGTSVPGTSDGTTIHAVNDPEMAIVVQGDRATFPDGVGRKIALRSVPSDRLPVDAPEFLPKGPVAILEPSGVTVSGGGAQIALPNTFGMDADTILPLVLFNSETGAWELGGFGRVSADARRVVSLPGMGIRHFSMVAVAPLGPRIEPLREDNQAPGADALKGALEQRVDLPAFRVNENVRAPALVYSSMTAAPTLLITGVFQGMRELVGTPEVRFDSQTVGDGVHLQAQIQTTVRRESGAWPEAITSRYFFSDIETGEFTLQGPPAKRGPAPPLGVADTRESFPTLPESLALTYLLTPTLADGTPYPTGLYNFLARYTVKGRSYEKVQSARVASSLLIDPEWRRLVADQAARFPGSAATDLLDKIGQIERMQQPGADVSIQYRYSGLLDYLFQDDAGCVVIHDLSRSPFGRGWHLEEVQEVHPLGRARVLVTGPEGRQVFTVRHTIQALSPGRYGAIALASDGQTVVGASVKPDGTPSGTVSGPGYSLTLPTVTRTDRYVTYQRQWLSNDVYRTVQGFVLVGGHWEFQAHSLTDFGFYWVEDYEWKAWQEYDHTDHYWSDWFQGAAGEAHVDVLPQVAGIAVAPDNILYVSDRATHRIFRISPGGDAVVVAGRTRIVDDRPSEQPSAQDRIDHAWSGEDINPGFTPDRSPAAGCQLDTPGGLALDPAGGLLFAETGTHRVRRLNFDTGLLETVAGTGGAAYDPDATIAAGAALPSPTAIACSAAGEVFVLLNLPGGTQAIGMVDRNGNYHHVVGDAGGTLDTGVDARRYRLVGAEHIAIGDTGRLFISVPAQNIVLVVDGGIIEPVAGSGEESAVSGDGGPALSASLIRPRGIALTPAGSLVVADTGDGDGHGAVRLVNLGLGALGWTELQGPAGYFGSTLRREPDGTWTRRYRDDSVAHFDATGRHVSTVDRNGNEVRYSYDESNRLVNVSYPRGASLSLRYSAGGTLEAITDHTQRVTRFTVDGADLRQVDLPDGARRSFTYDGAGRMVAQTDGLGVSTAFAYNDYGRLVARTCADQTVSVKRPDDLAAGNSASGDPIIAETSQTRLVAPDQTQTSYCIQNGRVTEVASVNGDTMQTSYGANGLPAEITRPNHKTIRVVYNDHGDVLQVRDEALQTVETYEYDARGHKTAYVDAAGRPSRWQYDAAGNLVESHIGQTSVVSSYAYDEHGMVTRKVEGGVTATFEYDDHGNLSRESRGSWEIRYERDAAGNPTAKTEGVDRRTGYRYDALNRLVEADEPRGKTAYRYDGAGRLTEVVDPRGGIHRFEFDARGNTTKKVDPAGRTWAYEYNASDQVVLEIAPDGIRFEHSQDNQRRMQTTIAPGMKLEQAQCQEGSLLWARTESAELHNHFDAKGQYVAQEIRLPVGPPVALRFQLDLAGKRTAVSCLENVTTYRYDDAGSLVEIEAGALGVKLERDQGGRVTRAVRRNGVSASVRFDEAGHATEIVETGPGDAATRWTAVFDPAGDCSDVTTADAAWHFEYDGMGQLVKASRDRGNLVLEYQYDALGNRISGPDGASQYDEHGLALVENAGWIYHHDARGRLVEKTSKANPQERHVFEYDVSSQLIGYRREDGGATAAVTARYAFDPTGRRIGKQVEYRDQPEKNQVLWWIYDGDNLFLELDGDFNVRRQYVYAQEVDSAIGFLEGGRAYYFARGHLGSIDRIYDDQGEVVARYEYDPFGNLLSEEGTVVNRIRFTGREWDEESATYHYRARQYDPQTGRFLQPDSQKGDATDPLTFINHYLYCRNSPLRYVDPYGLSWISDAWGAVKSAASWVWDKIAWVAAAIVAVAVVVPIIVFAWPLLSLLAAGVSVAADVVLSSSVLLLAASVTVATHVAEIKAGWDFATIPFRALLGLGFGLAVGIHESLTGGSFSEGFNRGWRVGSSLIPTLKWEKHDEGESRRLEGTLRGNYLNDAAIPKDGDENIRIEPSTEDSQALLVNRSGKFNDDPQIECEVDIPYSFKSMYHDFVTQQAASAGHVVAQGVWVDDAGHGRKTELHPLDMLVADIAPSQWPQVPTALNIQQSLLARLGEASMLVYRLLASGDNSPYLHPPLSNETRTVETWVALPPAPSVPGTTLRVSAEETAGTHSTPWLTRVDQGAGRLYITARLSSFMERGGPSVLFADIIVYWDT